MRYLTSLNFVSVTCKMRIIILPAGLRGAGRGENVLMYVKLLACDRCSFSFLLSHFPCPRESEGARWCSPRDQAQGSRPPSPPNPYCPPPPTPGTHSWYGWDGALQNTVPTSLVPPAPTGVRPQRLGWGYRATAPPDLDCSWPAGAGPEVSRVGIAAPKAKDTLSVAEDSGPS